MEKHDNMDKVTYALGMLEGLTQDDWRMFHSDSEVQAIAKLAFEALSEYAKLPTAEDGTVESMEVTYVGKAT